MIAERRSGDDWSFPFFTTLVTITSLGGNSFANGIVLDPSRGIILVNAHILGCMRRYKISIPDPNNPRHAFLQRDANVIKECINWDTDIALLRLKPHEDVLDFPVPVFAGVPDQFQKVRLASTVVDKKGERQELKTEGSVVNPRSTYATNLGGLMKLWDLDERFLPLSKIERSMRYEGFIFLNCRCKLLCGMSGSAVLDDQSRLLGILSRGSESGEGLAIPSKEIEKLLESAP